MKAEDLEKYVNIWCIPITKDLNTKDEIKKMMPFNCETRIARTTAKKWVLVRKLEMEDLKSMDFVKYLHSINIPEFRKTIVRLEH